MRIISKYHDYYDSAMSYGQDKTVVFVRNAVELKFSDFDKSICDILNPNIHLYDKKKKNTEISFQVVVIVFCGKTYRGIICNRTTHIPKQLLPQKEMRVFYNYDDLVEYLAKYEMKISNGGLRWAWQIDKLPEHIKGFLSAQGTKELEEFCINNRYVTLTHSNSIPFGTRYKPTEWNTVANGVLLDHYQFYRVFDAFMAYQELDMFISGVLPKSTQMPIEIEDKYRIEQHGFNKYSFRKQPEPKK